MLLSQMQMQQLYIAIILYDSVYCISTVIYIGTIPWKENFNQSIPTIYFNHFLGEAFTLIPKIPGALFTLSLGILILNLMYTESGYIDLHNPVEE